MQKLKLDFEQIALKLTIAGLQPGFADVDRLLVALQILLREVKHRLGEQRRNELLTHVEGQSAPVVEHL